MKVAAVPLRLGNSCRSSAPTSAKWTGRVCPTLVVDKKKKNDESQPCVCHVTCTRGARKNTMMMNFAVPFVLINLICAAAGSGSSTASLINEPTARPLLVDPNLPIIVGQQQQRQQYGRVHVDDEGRSSAGNSPVPESDMDYLHEDPDPSLSTTVDKDNFRSKWSALSRQKKQEYQQQQQQQQQPSSDFQDHFYLNPKFKEKDVPVPFTFSNFKRQQPSNFYTAAPYTSFQGQRQQQQQQQHQKQQQPIRPAWTGQSTATDPSFTREITIKQGRVKGIVRAMYRDSGIRDVDQFLGLPYAESPVGNKRFMPPGAPLPWPGVRVAHKLPPVCPQKLPKLDATGPGGTPLINKGRYNQLKRLFPYLKVESEDCLYLNLYVPRLDGKPIPKKFPVIVFVHGESYEWNSGNAYDGSVLASYGQVIVVTLNYRLGILGFMKPSVSDHAVSNFGLLDQVAALHWIKGNIGAFGGDNSAITLMGHGTGAALVNLLMVSPVAKGLFQRAILMSGSALSDWAITTHALQSTLQVTQGLNCPLNDNQEEVLTCLRRKRYTEILSVKTSAPEFSTSFGPVIDGLVIPNEAHVVMGQYSDLFSRYDLMFGVTELESYHALNAVALEHGLLEREKNNLLRFYMQNRFEIRPDIALVATVKEYTDSYTDPNRARAEEHRETLLEILSDARVVSPLIQTGIYHAKVNPRTYMYVFGHNSEAGDYSHLPLSVIGEELAYVFGAPLAEVGPFPRTFSAKERLLSEATMKYWANFAKTGNPKAPWKDMFINLGPPDWQKYDVDWSEYEPVNRTFLNLGLPPVVQSKYREKYADFWNNRLPEELRNVKNLHPSPPYAEYYGPAIQPTGTVITSPPVPTAPRGTMTDSFIGGKVNLYPNSNSNPNARPTEDPYKLLHLLGRNPGLYNVMAHPETAVEEGRGGRDGDRFTTERIIIVNPDNVLVQKADVTLYVLIFLVVLLALLLAAFGVMLKRAYNNKKGSSSSGGVFAPGNRIDESMTRTSSCTDKITSDVDDSYVIAPRVKKPANQKYESMGFFRTLLKKFSRKGGKKQKVFSHQSSKASEWMTTGELAKYSPKFESKLTLNRNSSFFGRPEKVSVAVDATPQNRSDSVLRQEPIEITKAKANYLHKNNDRIIICQEMEDIPNRSSYGSGGSYFSSDDMSSNCSALPINANYPHPTAAAAAAHPHGQYEEMMETSLGDDEQVTSFIEEINEDINVTSRDDNVEERQIMSPMETLSNIQRRNFPKVLPDHPEKNKRHSLPPPFSFDVVSVPIDSIDVHRVPTGTAAAAAAVMTLGRRCSNHTRRPLSRLIGASETQMASEPPQQEEPPTTSNTLIVGPLVKHSAESIYSTLKQIDGGGVCVRVSNQSESPSYKIPVLRREEQQPQISSQKAPRIGERKMMPLPADSTSNSSNDSVETVRQVKL